MAIALPHIPQELMESIILSSIAATPLVLFLLYIILKNNNTSSKSINTHKYPPSHGTVFHQLLYFNKLYDQQTQDARKTPTFRLLAIHIGQSEIYTADTRNIEHILKTRFDNYSKGKFNQEIVADLFGEGIFNVDGDKWKEQRKLASFEFSTRVLRDFSCSVFRINTAKLLRVVSKFTAHEGFDIQDLLMRCSLDSIFKVGFGVELNCLEESNEQGAAFMKAFDDSNALVYWRYVDPFWKLKRLLNLGSEASLRKNVKLIDDFVSKLVSTRRKDLVKTQSSDKEDILSRFLVESEKDRERMNDQYLRDIILNFMIAGKDSSANTLSWLFYALCKNPEIQEKVAQEVRKVTNTAEDETIDEFMAKITESTLQQMHYLHSALTETLRLYPAVPLDGRCAETDDILPDGYKVQKGDGVYYMAYAMGRMPYIWGDDAEEFRPERWLDSNGVFQPESPFKFIAFHAGPRICLGKEFAYRQMKIISMALLRFFSFRFADETRPVTYKTMFTLHIDGGLHLCATPRKFSG